MRRTRVRTCETITLGAKPMARRIGDEDAQPAIRQRPQIKQIAARIIGRLGPAKRLDSFDGRHLFGYQCHLHILGQRHLVLEDGDFLFFADALYTFDD